MAVPGDAISHAEGIEYRVGSYSDEEYALYYRRANEDWTSRFVFANSPRKLQDFEAMCQFHQSSAESPFMKQQICSLPLVNGRVTLAGDSLTLQENGQEVMKISIQGADERRELLHKYFRIELQAYDL